MMLLSNDRKYKKELVNWKETIMAKKKAKKKKKVTKKKTAKKKTKKKKAKKKKK